MTDEQPSATEPALPDGECEWHRVIGVDEFALHQPLSLWAVEAVGRLPQREDDEGILHALDVLSVVEAVQENPGVILAAQVKRAKDDLMAEMKSSGVEYDERIEELDRLMTVMDALWLTGVLTNKQRADGAYQWRTRVLRTGREIIEIEHRARASAERRGKGEELSEVEAKLEFMRREEADLVFTARKRVDPVVHSFAVPVVDFVHRARVGPDAHADAHFVVERSGSDAVVHRVDGDERLAELSRMLGGLPESPAPDTMAP